MINVKLKHGFCFRADQVSSVFEPEKKLEEGFIVQPVTVGNMIKSRLLIDFNFQKATVDRHSFEQVWFFNNVLCFLVNDSFQFEDALMYIVYLFFIIIIIFYFLFHYLLFFDFFLCIYLLIYLFILGEWF